MSAAQPSPLALALARRLRDSRAELTARWLSRIVDRVSVDPNRVFPTDDLLDHMPLLLDGIASHLEDPSRTIAGHGAVTDRARELGALRFTQGFSEHELQKEYELLGGILHAFAERVAAEHQPPATAQEALECAHRLFHAIALIQQATTSRFLEHTVAQLAEREERLQAFNRAITHEIRNRVGVTLGAGRLLQMPAMPDDKRAELADVVVRNANGMQMVLENLLELSRARLPARQQRHVRLPDAAAEAARQLRDAAQRRGVVVRLDDSLPAVEVNAAAVELVLANLISNGIKYSDPEKDERWVEVRGRVELDADGTPCQLRLEVVDNGLGIPAEARERLFERFFRAHEKLSPGVEGTGLGLNIVREVLEGIGGQVWAEFPPTGTVFVIAMPCRRAADIAVLTDQHARPLA